MDDLDLTNPEDTAAEDTEAPENEGVDANEAEDTADDGLDTEGDENAEEGDQEPDPETEDVELDGKNYKIPKAVKPLLLMQADYTKKTQAVAEKAKALESRESEITQRAEFQKANLADFAKLHTLQSDLKVYSDLTQEQWDAIKASDIDQYREHRDSFRDLKDQVAQLSTDLKTKEDQALSAADQAAKDALATQRREMAAVLTGQKKLDGPDVSIPGINGELLNKLGKFGTEAYGVSAEELGQITDPRIIKLLHDAYLGRQLKGQQKQVAKVEAQQKTAPARTVSGAAPGSRRASDPTGDKLSAEEWTRRRNAELRARQKA